MQSIMEKARAIRLLALDCDGVLTDGRLYYGNNGEELKAFSILDGLGIKLLRQSGIEVAIITGRHLKNPTLEQADAAIFGYCIMNDWSARYLQMEEMKLSLGPCKGKDFATGLGPWIVTKDELPLEPTPQGEVLNARMTCTVNGELLSEGNAATMNWTFAQILQRTAYGIDVNPGEVIGSGTVGTGCLLELNGSKITDNLWLKEGDVVVMEVDGLGRLENRIVKGLSPELPPTLVAMGPRMMDHVGKL